MKLIKTRRGVFTAALLVSVTTVYASSMFIDPTGFVGVGTETPSARLHLIADSPNDEDAQILVENINTDEAGTNQAAKKLARHFNRVAWPAFALAVATGIWNLFEVDLGNRSTDYQVLLMFKLLVVALSGVSAFVHTQATSRALLAIFGALTGITAIVAVGLGVLLLSST